MVKGSEMVPNVLMYITCLIIGGVNIGKVGVVSPLHFMLTPQPCEANTGNGSGQNKNRFVMQYLAWRVSTERWGSTERRVSKERG